MKKSMKKTAFALCVALSVFMCNSAPAFASARIICNGSPDHYHHFSKCQLEKDGYSKDGGTHSYLYGFDINNNPVYKNDCRITMRYQYCNYVCAYCNTKQDGARHEHHVLDTHSVVHRSIEGKDIQ